MGTLSILVFVALVLAGGILEHIYSRRRLWHLEQQMGLCALILSREWKVGEDYTLIEFIPPDKRARAHPLIEQESSETYLERSSSKMRFRYTRATVRFEGIKGPLREMRAKPGDLVEFAIALGAPGEPRATELYVCRIIRAHEFQPA